MDQHIYLGEFNSHAQNWNSLLATLPYWLIFSSGQRGWNVKCCGLLCLINHKNTSSVAATVIQLPWQQRKGAHPCTTFLKQSWKHSPNIVQILVHKSLRDIFLKANIFSKLYTSLCLHHALCICICCGRKYAQGRSGFSPRQWLLALSFILWPWTNSLLQIAGSLPAGWE